MTIKEFLEMYGGEEINLTLFDLENNVCKDTTTHYMMRDDGLNEEWKTAYVTQFYIDSEDSMCIDVRKKYGYGGTLV